MAPANYLNHCGGCKGTPLLAERRASGLHSSLTLIFLSGSIAGLFCLRSLIHWSKLSEVGSLSADSPKHNHPDGSPEGWTGGYAGADAAERSEALIYTTYFTANVFTVLTGALHVW